jgi:hypothetical protein
MKSDAVRTFFFENETRQCLVYGNSMAPFLTYGDSVEIKPCPGPLKKGHCYAFITGKHLTFHRFIKMAGNECAVFAGDNCLFFDRVALSDIVGELSPCQNPGILIIISSINSLFCHLTLHIKDISAFHSLRRRIIKSIIGFEKKRGIGHEKKIRKA